MKRQSTIDEQRRNLMRVAKDPTAPGRTRDSAYDMATALQWATADRCDWTPMGIIRQQLEQEKGGDDGQS